ncbi:hypothetical protein CDAR_27021 [Caerostris darwini]|uniref:Uncharacterized protein n=1 Tax=Caerostris darwini TaxID=1538125 RepID=A0AAV4TB18_9ARAC|nr:hypothetical protein CDAR_27021 [Caerostris darwini]
MEYKQMLFVPRALDAYRLLSGLNCSEMKKRCICSCVRIARFPTTERRKPLIVTALDVSPPGYLSSA